MQLFAAPAAQKWQLPVKHQHQEAIEEVGDVTWPQTFQAWGISEAFQGRGETLHSRCHAVEEETTDYFLTNSETRQEMRMLTVAATLPEMQAT